MTDYDSQALVIFLIKNVNKFLVIINCMTDCGCHRVKLADLIFFL